MSSFVLLVLPGPVIFITVLGIGHDFSAVKSLNL
jgi:hypothetical protein